jgi:hypothetical protein
MSGGIVVTPSFVFDLESRMRLITSTSYSSLLAKLWWQQCTKTVDSQSAREIMMWLLDTASIEYTEEGNIEFEELSHRRAEFRAEYAAKGFKVRKSKFQDLDGNGIAMATEWSRQIGAYAAYFPQKHVAKALIAGTSSLGYDGVNFFSTAHPLDPFNTAAGTFSNLLTTGVKLDDRHTLETAFNSLNVIKTAIASVKMPNGESPRNLVIRGFLAPTAMCQRLNLLLDAKFISVGGGPTDVEGAIQAMGFKGGVIECQELGAAYGGSDTDCYILCEELGSPDLDALVWIEREPFAVQYYSGADGGNGMDAVLNRARELEWHVQGRNSVGYGHPFKIFKLVGQAP